MVGSLFILTPALLCRIVDAAPCCNSTAPAKDVPQSEDDLPTPRGSVMTAGASATIVLGAIFMLATIAYYVCQCQVRLRKRVRKGKANCTDTPLNTLNPRRIAEVLGEGVAEDEANDRRWRAVGLPVSDNNANDNNGQVAPPSPALSYISMGSLVSDGIVRPPLSTSARATEVTRRAEAGPEAEDAATEAVLEAEATAAEAVPDAATPKAKVASTTPIPHSDYQVVSKGSASSEYSEYNPSEANASKVGVSGHRISM